MLTDPRHYVNRELSWLKFNQRVLQEAIDPANPLLEQLKFIAIAASNMDEFFMIRVAGLKHQKASGVIKYDAAHMNATDQLEAIAIMAKRQMRVMGAYAKSVIGKLEEKGILFIKPEECDTIQLDWIRHYFERTVYPVVTPLAVDSGHPFPFLANRTLNAVVSLKRLPGENKVVEDNPLTINDEEVKVAILPIPSVLDRIVELPSLVMGERIFMYLEDIILYFANQFFRGYEVTDQLLFRLTRDAYLDIDEEEAKDLLVEVEKSLRQRRKGTVVRMEVNGREDSELLAFLIDSLQIEEDDIFMVQVPLDARMYFSFTGKAGFEDLRYSEVEPSVPADLVEHEGDLFSAIRKRDVFVHHPYESFEPVIDFVRQAAADPDVLAIKQTLYRVSGDSPIIKALMQAADNGKQVTVLMEVKARFDEENNIIMARRLEKSGCHVIYGLVGLKTHSKITMVVRREEDGIRRYVHLATGNYNGSTAKIYTDCGIFTCNDEYGEDASAFFNLISGYSDPPVWNKFIVAPLNLREKIVSAIDEEIAYAESGEEAHIIAKMNSLLDKKIIAKLYEASSKGVRIDLIVRGICALRPGLPGVSENITVRSIVGRFLEHHRLFYFRHGGHDDTYLSSADWMPRNLNERVELMIPIEEPLHKQRVRRILDLCLEDNQKVHIMCSDGTYRKIMAKQDQVSVQSILLKEAQKAVKREDAKELKIIEPIYGMGK